MVTSWSLPLVAMFAVLSALTSGLLVLLWQQQLRRKQALNIESQIQPLQQQMQEQQLELARWQERGQSALQQIQQLQQQYEQERQHWQQQNEALQQRLLGVQRQLATEQEARIQEQKHADEKLALLEHSKQQTLKEFELLSNKVFSQTQQQFGEQSKQGLEALLSPFREQLEGLRKKVEDVYVSDVKDRSELKHQIESLHQLNQQITAEAHALTTALRGEKKMQGNWGELLLENVLESSGLRAGEEYLREDSHKDDEGNRYRPDVTILLPEGKRLIIDSKISLNAYTDYVNADNDADREQALRRHIEATRQHIRSLSEKAYQKLPNINSPDFVFLFMAIEPAFMLAYQHDSALFTEAFDRKIVVVTPTTLLATLRTVASIWVIERRSRGTEKLAEQASKVYDKLVSVVERFEKLGSQINTVQRTYDDAWAAMKMGKGNLLSQTQKFVELGVGVKKELSRNLVMEALEQDGRVLDDE